MIAIDARRTGTPRGWTADVCIVGAGAAGLTLADRLVSSGFSVVVVESGGLEYDRYTTKLDALNSVGYPQREAFLSRARGFGGTCQLWGGQGMELQTIDFQKRAWVPWSGWPIKRDDIAGYFEPARRVLGIPAIELAHDRLLRTEPQQGREQELLAGSELDLTVATVAERPQRFGESFQKKVSSSTTFAVFLHTSIVRIDLDPAGWVTGLRGKTLSDHDLHFRARAFVLACGGLETPRLLLVSRATQKEGIGNEHDLVGRFFMDHPRAVHGRIRLSGDHLKAFWGRRVLPGGRLRLGLGPCPEAQERYGLLNHSVTLERKLSILFEQNHPLLVRIIRSAARQTGTRMRFQVRKSRAKDFASGISCKDRMPFMIRQAMSWLRWGIADGDRPRDLALLYNCEQPPNPASRVYLDREVDPLGMNRLVLDWKIDPSVHESMLWLQRQVAAALERHWLGELQADKGLPEFTDASHHMGTTRMSASPRDGVVNPNCRVHGVKNLFVASSAVFPTGGHANPTLTIVALSLRLADYLKGWLARDRSKLLVLSEAARRSASHEQLVSQRVSRAGTDGPRLEGLVVGREITT